MAKRDFVIGILEDDADQSALFQSWLQDGGYKCQLFASAAEFRRRLGGESVDLLLLDWMLPDATGIEIIQWIRSSANAELPVIFLTARTREADIVLGLSSGGDDFVVKPPKPAELIARVEAVLRRRRGGDEGADSLDLAPYRFDLPRRRVTLNEVAVELTQREFDLGAYLFRRHGRIVSRDALLENVWNLNAAVSTRTVDTHISRLRKKLELSGEHGWRLNAVYQHGYRLERS